MRLLALRARIIPAVGGLGLLLAAVLASLSGFDGARTCEHVPAPVEPVDRITERRVTSDLSRDERLAGADIDVAVTDGAVRLTGNVRSQRERLTALLIATSAPGARVLIDELDISTSE